MTRKCINRSDIYILKGAEVHVHILASGKIKAISTVAWSPSVVVATSARHGDPPLLCPPTRRQCKMRQSSIIVPTDAWHAVALLPVPPYVVQPPFVAAVTGIYRSLPSAAAISCGATAFRCF